MESLPDGARDPREDYGASFKPPQIGVYVEGTVTTDSDPTETCHIFMSLTDTHDNSAREAVMLLISPW
jgi:hypothetical protein